MKHLIIINIILLQCINYNLSAQDNSIIADEQYGCDSLKVSFSLETTSGVTSAVWDFGNGDTYNGITPPVISYGEVGVYDVSVVINGTETIRADEFIGVFPEPPARFFFNDSVLSGSYNMAFTVAPQGAPFDTVQYFYNWEFGDGTIFQAVNRQHGHRYPDAGEYIVDLTVNDRYGCANSSSDTIIISDRFSVCNIFTPNDDNINDEFVIETNGLSVYSLIIFTRTGTMVYKTEGPTLRWDGRDNAGVKMPRGIYYYIVKEINGSRNKAGFFYIQY